jgi:L-ascorbate metabolism protein UlaG (beta-lactamase superfamily)
VEHMLGGAKITYLGHATFLFTTAEGEQINIDPFLTDNPQTPEELKRGGQKRSDLWGISISPVRCDHIEVVKLLYESRSETNLTGNR